MHYLVQLHWFVAYYLTKYSFLMLQFLLLVLFRIVLKEGQFEPWSLRAQTREFTIYTLHATASWISFRIVQLWLIQQWSGILYPPATYVAVLHNCEFVNSPLSFIETDAISIAYCNLLPCYTCRTAVIFCYRNVFRNGVDATFSQK